MIPNAYALLVILGFALTLVSGTTGKIPVWIPLLLITIALLISLAGRV